MLKFSNPRRKATFTDWPLGLQKRGQCVFEVEANKKGERINRTTTGKPKSDIAYSGKGCIVDGSDGRTYLLQFSDVYGFITIYQSNMMCAQFGTNGDHAAFPDSSPERYAELKALIDTANA